MANFQIRIIRDQADLDACMAIRKEVFVAEQHVPLELEMDEFDASALHILLYDSAGPAIATARIVDKHGAAKIGRVAVIKEWRGRGVGLQLMRFVLETAKTRGFDEAVLDSQTYAIPFYERLGFIAEGDEFDDAGIAHFRMRRRL